MFNYVLAALAALCLLTGCDSTASLKELRTAQPTGDAYQKALAADYRDYAEQKVAAYEWATSTYFADKGLMAAYGRTIEPEKPESWGLPITQRAEFDNARAKLMTAIANNRSLQPELTASAVVAYDRWIEMQHLVANPAKVEEQRDVFFALLAKLEEAHTASSPEAAVSTATATPAPIESTSTILYFPMNSDHLGDSAQGALAELVRYVTSAGNVTVTINGHADRVGTEQYNMDLSQRRARFVLKALKAAGVPEKMMNYFAFGESDPAVPTADDVAEPKNRRVEIYIE